MMFEIGTFKDHFPYLGVFALLILEWSWFLAQNGRDPHITSSVLFQNESMM
jgi:hypothetical protein